MLNLKDRAECAMGSKNCSAASVSEALQGGANSRTGAPHKTFPTTFVSHNFGSVYSPHSARNVGHRFSKNNNQLFLLCSPVAQSSRYCGSAEIYQEISTDLEIIALLSTRAPHSRTCLALAVLFDLIALFVLIASAFCSPANIPHSRYAPNKVR